MFKNVLPSFPGSVPNTEGKEIHSNSMSLAMDANRHIGLIAEEENDEHGKPHTAFRDYDLLSVLRLVLHAIKKPALRYM